MLNIEYYKEKIEELDYNFGLYKGKLYSCDEINCSDCAFESGEYSSCNEGEMKWLSQECITLNDDELNFLKLINPEFFMIRNKNDSLYIYPKKPLKNTTFHYWDSYDSAQWINNELFPNLKFEFIKWEDKEPWKVRSILELIGEETC